MRTTIELPDELFRRTKATAALRGISMRELVAQALRDHLERTADVPAQPGGWRSVFGLASPDDVAPVDAAVEEDLEQVDPGEWT